MQIVKKYWQVLFIIALGLYLTLYISPFNDYNSRILQDVWSLGHVILFFFISLSIIHLEHHHLDNGLKEFSAVVLLPSLLGVGIESIQPLFGRDFQINDIVKNACGSLLAFALFAYHMQNKLFLTRGFKAASCLALIITLKPFSITLYDSYRASVQFPILSDFESNTEISRFHAIGNHTKISIQQLVSNEKPALAFTVSGDNYAGVSMDYLPNDWSGYQFLAFSVFQEMDNEQNISIRVHDYQHPKNGFNYEDRFNQSLTMNKGWNHFKINLETIKNAPSNRALNLQEVANVSLFMQKPTSQTLWLNHIKLTKSVQH